jgi:hypothetical protein
MPPKIGFVPDDDVLVVDGQHAAAAPLDAEREQVVAIEDLQPRLDLHLRNGDVERFADQLTDALEVGRMQPQKQRVRGAVCLHRASARRDLLGRRRRRRAAFLRGRTKELRERRLGDGATRRRFDDSAAGAELHLAFALFLADLAARLDGGGSGPQTEQARKRVGHFSRVRVGQTHRHLGQGAAGKHLGGHRVGRALAVLHLLLLERGLRRLRADFRLGLGLGLLGLDLRFLFLGASLSLPDELFTLLGELLRGDDANDAVVVDALQAAGLEDHLQRERPRDVPERDRHLAFDVVAHHDVASALSGEDA